MLIIMDKKEVLLYGVLVAILVGCTLYVLLPSKLKLYYILDNAHLATERPDGTFRSMLCPHDDSELAQIAIIHHSNIVDAPWRYAFYCEIEDIFWINNYQGGISEARWYGPFKGHLKWTNSLTICGSTLSGIALVLIVLKKTLYK